MNTKFLAFAPAVLVVPACAVTEAEVVATRAQAESVSESISLLTKTYLSRSTVTITEGGIAKTYRYRVSFFATSADAYSYDGEGTMEYEAEFARVNVNDPTDVRAGIDDNGSFYYVKRTGSSDFALFDCASTSACYDGTDEWSKPRAFTQNPADGANTLRLAARGVEPGNDWEVDPTESPEVAEEDLKWKAFDNAMSAEMIFDLADPPELKMAQTGLHTACPALPRRKLHAGPTTTPEPAPAPAATPYAALDLHVDGTFTATTATAPSLEVHGRWVSATSSVTNLKTHKFSWNEYVQLVEDGASQWAFNGEASQSHTFYFDARSEAEGSYRVSWRGFSYPTQIFVAGNSADACPSTATP